MAHPLGALYDTPHGIANAIILPTVMEYNAEATGEKYREIARAMGVKGVDDMTQEEYRKAAVDAVKQLSQDVGIPAFSKLTGQICDIFKDVLGIAPDHVYVKYQAVSNWGWNGDNF